MAVAVQVPVVHAVNRGAAALDDGALGVAALRPLVDIDLQRPLVAAPAQEGQSLLLTVAVQVHQLQRLQVGARRGGGVLRPGLDELADGVVQLGVLRRELGQGVEVLRRRRQIQRAAGEGPHETQRRQQRREKPFHAHPSFRRDRRIAIQGYYTTSSSVLVVPLPDFPPPFRR